MQCNEVSSSYQIEKEGLHRAFKFLEQQNLNVEVLVTDRHLQINKWMRETYPEVKHYFDVWHVAKGELCYVHRLGNSSIYMYV